MRKILLAAILVSVGLYARSQSSTNNPGFELMSVTDGYSENNQQIEKFVLQFWYLIKIKDLESAEKFTSNPKPLKKIFEKLEKPINYSWKIIRSYNKKTQKRIIDIFVSYPQYSGDPEREPFLQIRGVIDEPRNGNQFENIDFFSDRRVDIKKFLMEGIYPAHLTLPSLYLIKNRTARTVLDSLALLGQTDDFLNLSNRIIEKLENNEQINSEDFGKLIENYVSSETAFFPIKLFGDHYNKYVLSGKKLYDNSIEESNYFLREGILLCIDDKLKLNDDFAPFRYIIGDSCRATPGKTQFQKTFSEAQENLVSANNDYAIQLLLKSSLPPETKKELEIFCGAESWVETRFEDVKKGQESYVKLFALKSIMTRRMLEIMSEHEEK